MRILKTVLPVLLIGYAATAAVIDLSGTVTNSSDKPIKGALISLTGQDFADTTDEKGAFSILDGKVMIATPNIPLQKETIVVNKGVVEFCVAQTSPVTIDLYDMRGALLKRLVDNTIHSGSYRYDISADPVATRMLVVKATVGREQAVFRYLPLQGSFQNLQRSGTRSTHQTTTLAKIAATIDTLKVSAEGFKDTSILLSTYETTFNIKLDSIPALDLDTFSFFITSYKAIEEVSGSKDGFGGDLRFGFTGKGAGLKGADSICSCIAEMSMPGASAKQWRAFLSVEEDENGKPVNARDRIGEGPWYDRLGRMLSPDLDNLINERPEGGHTTIKNDLPNEDGIPNHRPEGETVDNHHFLTGSDENAELKSGRTCDDWTSTSKDHTAQMGLAWPRAYGGGFGGMSGNWISAVESYGCEAGTDLDGRSMAGVDGVYTIGNGGGYGGFYCFALTP